MNILKRLLRKKEPTPQLTNEERAQKRLSEIPALAGFTIAATNNWSALVEKNILGLRTGHLVRAITFNGKHEETLNESLPCEWPEDLPVTMDNASMLQKQFWQKQKEFRNNLSDEERYNLNYISKAARMRI